MSLLGAMTTSISGLSAQSKALANVSDNIANSQTTGFKRTDTNFIEYLNTYSQRQHMSGSVQARPDYTTTVQGTIQASDNDLSLAIAGQGFFPVALPSGSVNGQVGFDERDFYTRAGNFAVDKDGYLVNGQGYALQGWQMLATGEPDRTSLDPLRIQSDVYNPVATSTIDLSASLPADLAVGESFNTQVQIYDALGTQHAVTLGFTKTANNVWSLSASASGNGPFDASLAFGSAATTPTAPGTIGETSTTNAGVTLSASTAGSPASMSFDMDFGQGTQPVTLNFGTFGATTGLTQYAGTEFSLRSLAQDGVPLGSYSGLSIGDNGDVVLNYDNGQSRTVARVPIASFNDADKLQGVDGQAYLASSDSGIARMSEAQSDGAGKLVVGSLEGSNVDIASEFSKLILAQRAYTASSKVVTAADEMLQDTLNMRR